MSKTIITASYSKTSRSSDKGGNQFWDTVMSPEQVFTTRSYCAVLLWGEQPRLHPIDLSNKAFVHTIRFICVSELLMPELQICFWSFMDKHLLV